MQERLSIVRPPVLGEELARAVHAVCTGPAAVSADGLHNVRARLACGDFESVRAALHASQGDAALPVALARYLRWSGDIETATALWPRVRESLAASEADPSLRAATYAELPATATDVGDPQLAARLIGSARTASAPVATQDRVPGAHESLVCDVAYHLLGLDPDATRGRLHLRPRLIDQSTLEARHIRFAGGSVRMSADLEGDDCVIRVEQDAGPVPFTVLLEPLVHSASGAVVDGVDARLDARESAEGVVVPVQLVLDDVRTLMILGARSPG